MGFLGGLIGKFKGGLQRTREVVFRPMGHLLGLRHLDEAQLQEVEDLLLQADLGAPAVGDLMARLRTELKRSGSVDPRAILREALLTRLRGFPPKALEVRGTQVLLLVGVNGVGKTTTLGKLAAHLKARGDDVLIVAGDTFRAAAIDQLEHWGERAGVPVIRNQMGGDPAAVAFDGAAAAVARRTPWVLIDTAGRLHTKDHLMRELEKIRRSLQKVLPEAPHRVFLVLDATTGQNGLAQAEAFRQVAGVTDLVLTKLDGSAKGGVVVPILERLRIPIAFVGLGEGLDDLVPFDPEAFVDGLLGP
ncbi:MAG: signal recognition particle-docking protein FtsY [Acidobacteria bacterium]|nr:signal recognition particle-docking protein FtsY [Acidobacteriota bacterium]